VDTAARNLVIRRFVDKDRGQGDPSLPEHHSYGRRRFTYCLDGTCPVGVYIYVAHDSARSGVCSGARLRQGGRYKSSPRAAFPF
jgi:hypothetical protein